MSEAATGYHFTPWATWRARVRHEGLVPQSLAGVQPFLAGELRAMTGTDRYLWLWPRLFTGLELAGCVLDRMMRHRAPRVLLLEVTYDRAAAVAGGQVPPGRGYQLTFRHDGALSKGEAADWYYHRDAPFVLLGTPVPRERLRVVGDFDVPRLLGRGLRVPTGVARPGTHGRPGAGAAAAG